MHTYIHAGKTLKQINKTKISYLCVMSVVSCTGTKVAPMWTSGDSVQSMPFARASGLKLLSSHFYGKHFCSRKHLTGASFFYFETWSLSESGDCQLAGLTGQGAPGIHLSLPPQCWPSLYFLLHGCGGLIDVLVYQLSILPAPVFLERYSPCIQSQKLKLLSHQSHFPFISIFYLMLGIDSRSSQMLAKTSIN